jgi:2-oxoglutarate dehydrogenase E2 component (dihydrolipoamide succinyltransferase)
VLQEILVLEGETVAVGTVLARIGGDLAGDGAPTLSSAPALTEQEASPFAVPPPAAGTSAGSHAEVELPLDTTTAPREAPVHTEAPGHRVEAPAEAEAPAHAVAPTQSREAAHAFVSPVVARISAEHGIDPTTLRGSGRDGRVTKKDVLALVDAEADLAPSAGSTPLPATPAPAPPPLVAAPEPQPASDAGTLVTTPTVVAPAETTSAAGAPAAPTPVAAAFAPAPTQRAPGPQAPLPSAPEQELEPGEHLEPMSIMRRGIAEHMRRSLDTAAHVTSAIEVDMSKVAAIRDRIKAEYASSYGINPTYLAFIARATVDALHDWPWINAELRGESILTRSHVNLGFAVSLEGGKGLIVPVLKHAEGLNLLGMARGIADLAGRARTKRLLPDDVQGGTFTITNPGSFGTLHGTPIISQPQSAILGTYAIVKRPWVIADDEGQDAIAIRSIMNLTLTYDHRLVDGAYGAQFLRDLAERLQTWAEADY